MREIELRPRMIRIRIDDPPPLFRRLGRPSRANQQQSELVPCIMKIGLDRERALEQRRRVNEPPRVFMCRGFAQQALEVWLCHANLQFTSRAPRRGSGSPAPRG